MSANPQRKLPDFLPILTEVVSPLPDGEPVGVNEEEWVEHIMRQLTPLLTVQLRDRVAQLLQEQMSTLQTQLRQEAEAAVRQAVAQLARSRRDAGDTQP